MSIKASELIEILKDHPDADVCACKCAEELIVSEKGREIFKIPLLPPHLRGE
jgi:hypothetical protein